jgi:hypothetical protein
MTSWFGPTAWAKLCLWPALLLVGGCQLLTGVDDLRVEDITERSDNTDKNKDAAPSDESQRSDGSVNGTTRSDDDQDASLGSATTEAESTDDRDSSSRTDDSDGPSSTDDSSNTDGTDGGDGCDIPAQLICAPITNCGCEDGTACSVAAEDGELTLACVSPGNAELGESCAVGGCKSGYHCWDGLCRQACTRAADCDEEGATCQDLRTDGSVLSKVKYCHAPCDLRAPTEPLDGLHACEEGQACVRSANSSVCSSSVGQGTAGGECEHDMDCAVGLGCIDDVCKPWCNPEEGGCGNWAECQGLTDIVGAVGAIGVCEGTCPVAAVEGSTCGLLPNCGCAGGQSCRVVESTGRTECSVIGFGVEQGACESDFDCQSGLACVSGLCRPYCQLDAPQCPDSSPCFPLYYDDVPIEGVGICAGSCDAVWPDNDDELFTPCGDGALCEPGFGNSEVLVPHCIAQGDATLLDYGEVCVPSTDLCQVGSVCTGTCQALCREAADCDWANAAISECLDSPDAFLDADGSEFGVCCLPGPHPDSTCSAFGVDCGCTEDEACRPALDSNGAIETDGRTACFPAGDTPAQTECSTDDDCVRGTSCVDSLCRPHCTDTCGDTGGRCVQISVG